MGAKTSKRYSNLKSLLNPFKLPEISSQLSSQKYGFWNFEFMIFHNFFSFAWRWDPNGSQNFKTLLLPQISFESFQPFLEFSSQLSSQKYCFGFLKFKFQSFHEFLNSTIVPGMGKPKTSIVWKTSDRGAKLSEIWASGVSLLCIQGLWHLSD